jgi:hypothetical protein
MKMSNVQVMPPANRTTVTLAGGRTFTCAYGAAISVPNWVADQLEANGWQQVNADTTANRPTGIQAGFLFMDTTLGKVIKYNGKQWHDLLTGNIV